MLARLSLRARLILGVIALAAVGLVAADVATYSSLRSFLLDRTDSSLERGARRGRRTRSSASPARRRPRPTATGRPAQLGRSDRRRRRATTSQVRRLGRDDRRARRSRRSSRRRRRRRARSCRRRSTCRPARRTATASRYFTVAARERRRALPRARVDRAAAHRTRPGHRGAAAATSTARCTGCS